VTDMLACDESLRGLARSSPLWEQWVCRGHQGPSASSARTVFLDCRVLQVELASLGPLGQWVKLGLLEGQDAMGVLGLRVKGDTEESQGHLALPDLRVSQVLLVPWVCEAMVASAVRVVCRVTQFRDRRECRGRLVLPDPWALLVLRVRTARPVPLVHRDRKEPPDNRVRPGSLVCPDLRDLPARWALTALTACQDQRVRWDHTAFQESRAHRVWLVRQVFPASRVPLASTAYPVPLARQVWEVLRAQMEREVCPDRMEHPAFLANLARLVRRAPRARYVSIL